MKSPAPQPAGAVRVRRGTVVLPTYLPAAADRNPMFLEQRVYQGSSGKVYPLPFTDRIAESPVPRAWQAIWLENEFLQVLILPDIGGRIHRLLDKTNGYDLIYHQPVIKPALVGLAGPWISGGIEFNWPQHHRPATFMPVDTAVERDPEGSITVWCGDHDPLARMKAMHGVCLHPGRAYLELRVRVSNRTAFTQTFLWWANVATRVHEGYQSFFPPDVYYVADHARRSMSEYPLAQGRYYGVDYGERGKKGIPASEVPAQYLPPHCGKSARGRGPESLPDYAPNDLSFYANIPVPTSYMCMGSQEDFFGGYDHRAQAGLVHLADHHIAPGKKQWTWGNHAFGYAWDRNLTDATADGEFPPYIELMAGVFTDNQPDFSFLQPGEAKSWSQYWYPLQKIGPAQHANLDAAASLALGEKSFRLGVCVTRAFPHAVVRLERADGSGAAEWDADLAPGQPFVLESPQARKPWRVGETVLRVLDRAGRELLRYAPKPRVQGEVPPAATEPPAPADVASADELFLIGQHLSQYRHATRCPTPYWREALRRDPGDARCHNALGLWHLQRGEFSPAEAHFRQAIARLTQRNANPADGEAFYNLGLCLRYQADAWLPEEKATQPKARRHTARQPSSLHREAYAAFAKATWNAAWVGPACLALAELDGRNGDWAKAAEHAHRAYQTSAHPQRAQNLWTLALRKSGDRGLVETLLRAFRRTDPLDWWTRHQLGESMTCDAQTLLDVALDYARAGSHAEAIALLAARVDGRSQTASTDDPRDLGTAPLLHYYLGWLHTRLGQADAAREAFKQAAAAPPDYCFPARLEEIAILQTALAAQPTDARAAYYLGNLLYDRRRHDEAIRLWERSAALDPDFSVVWRNLGLGYFNLRQQPRRAVAAYARACAAHPTDARLRYERDQLWKRTGVAPRRRLRELERHLDLVRQRDDLSVELCALYNQVGRPADALALVQSRHFQPWEGGEGGPLGQWVRAHLALGKVALRRTRAKAAPGSLAVARDHFQAALTAPPNLGEARHLLANQSDVHYWLGTALAALGDSAAARQHWLTAATFRGDFQAMSVRACSEMTYYSALAWQRLGEPARAQALLKELLAYARQLGQAEAKLDYFATSLPLLLLFADDLAYRQQTTALFLQAQARLGLRQRAAAKDLLRRVLERDPNHALAADLARELASAAPPCHTPP